MNTKLFIRNLSWSVAENDLYDLFEQVGEVVSVKIPTRREDGKPRGFAFAEMGSPELAKAVIDKFNGHMLDNRDIVIDYQDENRGGGNKKPVKNSKLFVRNIDASVGEDALQSFFEKAGTVYSVKIITDRDTGESRGFGFVEMASADEAEEAINTLNNSNLGGGDLIIDFQDPNRSGNRPRRQGGYRQNSHGYGRSAQY